MNRVRIRKMGLLLAGLAFAATAYVVIKSCFSAADVTSYTKFLGKIQKTMSGYGKAPYSAEQSRQGISREIWFSKGSDRFKLFVTADEAEVAYEGVGSNLEIIENLKGVKGWLQNQSEGDESGVPQLVRYLQADSAFYHNAKRLIGAENVKIALYTGFESQETVKCSARSLDVLLLEKTAHLEGDVVFSHPLGTLSAERVNVEMEDEILAEGNVEINQNGKWLVKAEKGRYIPGERPKVILWSEINRCEASDFGSLTIHSKTIEAMPKTGDIVFFEPEGTLCIKEQGDQKEMLHFASGSLICDEKSGMYILKDHVKLALPSQNAVLTTDHEIHIHNSEKQVQEFVCTGKTEFSFETEEHDFSLSCRGQLNFDRKNCLLHMKSTAEGDQLFFHDNMGKVYADEATLEFQEIENRLVPIRVVFNGDVLVLNREPPFLQKALSDRLTFLFSTHEVTFEANPKRRVLLFDQANNLEMSAKGIKMKRDKQTNKESIQAIGDLRLKFDEEEFAQLKKRFLMDADGNNETTK